MSRFKRSVRAFVAKTQLLGSILRRHTIAAISVLLVSSAPNAYAQAPGFLGYVLNSSGGTVSIFAAESDDSRIGNNDHPISTVKVGSNPEMIAVSPDGHYAFVSSPGDNTVWQIDVSDPTKPIASKMTTFNSLGTPGGIAVTTFTDSDGNTQDAVWVADSKSCVMHVLTTPNFADTPQSLSPPASVTPSTSTAVCGSLIDPPTVIATPDQQTAVFASFDEVEFENSSTVTAPYASYVYAFDATFATTNPAPLSFSFTLQRANILSAMQDPDDDILLFIGDFGGPNPDSTAPAVYVSRISGLAAVSPEQTVTSSFASSVTPISLTTNNLDGSAINNINDNRTDTAFYLFVGDSAANLTVYSIDCGTASAPSVSCTSALTVGTEVTFTLGSGSGLASGLAAVPSSYEGDGRASIIYVATDVTGGAGLQLVLGEGPGKFPTPCIVGTTGCGGLTVAGGQVYNTAVPTGSGPVGVTFGPIYPSSPALTWLTGYTTTGTGPYTPLQPSPSSSSAPNPLPMYVDQGTLLSNIDVQALSMVSNLLSATLSSQITVASETNNSNYGCGPGVTTCTGPTGPETQSVTFNVNGTDPTNPTSGAGDVTTISFQGTPSSSNDCSGSDCSQSTGTTLETKSLCTLQVNGGTATLNIVQGTSVNANLNCTGVVSDTLQGTITWGDTSSPVIVHGIAQGATPVNVPASGFPTHPYATTGQFFVTATATDTTNPNNQYSVSVTNSPPGITVNVIAKLSVSTTSLPNGNQGSTYGPATLEVSGGTAPYTWSIISGALPAGLNLNASSGQIGGTPTAAGTFNFTVQVKDSGSPAQTVNQSLSLIINGPTGGTLAITTTSLPAGEQSSSYGPATVQVGGGTAPYSWSVSSGSLPSGLSLTSSDGQIGGTPTAAGTFNFTVQVKDSSSPPQTASQGLSIVISPAVPPLSITTTSVANGTQNSAYGPVTVQATGGTTPYTWSLSSGTLPTGLSLNASNGQISGTPTTSGTFNFTVQVKDSGSPAQTATQSLSITIAAGPTNPTIIPNATSAAVVPGQSANFQLGLQGNAADAGVVFAITCQGLPQGSACSYSPSPFALDTNGVGTVVVTISTTGQGTAASVTPGGATNVQLWASFLSFSCLVGLLLIGRGNKEGGRRHLAYSLSFSFLLVTVLISASACNTTVTSNNLTCPSCTPAGTSSVKIAATSQHPALQSSTTVQLQVGPTVQ